jgi:hypothetical protein
LAAGSCERSCDSQGAEQVVKMLGGTWGTRGTPWGVCMRDSFFAAFVEGTAVIAVGRERAGDVVVSFIKAGATLYTKHLTFGLVPELSTRGGEAVIAGGDFRCVCVCVCVWIACR